MMCADDQPAVVLQLGPPTGAVGGMASVVEQMQRLDFRNRYRLAVLPGTSSSHTKEWTIAKAVRHVKHLRTLWQTIRTDRVELLHIHTCSGFSFYRSMIDALVARCQGVPVVLHVHGAAFDEFFHNANSLSRRIIRWGLESSSAVIALSATWRDRLLVMASGARVCVIENAVEFDPAPFGTPDAKACIDQKSNDPCHFVLLARMDVWKGIEDLLEACALLKKEGVSFRVTLAGPPGSAGDASTLPQHITALGLDQHVKYVGSVHGNDKERLLNSADVYVQPSHNEGMPISVLEAIAHGLPVIATRVGAMPEVLSHEREGLLVSSHDPPRLAAAMSELARNPSTRLDMGVAARRLAIKRFGVNRLHDDLGQLYDGVLARTRSGDDSSDLRPVAPIESIRPCATARRMI